MVGNGYLRHIVTLISGFTLLTQVLRTDCFSSSKKTTYVPTTPDTRCKDKNVCQEVCVDSPSGPLCSFCSEGRYLSTDNKTCTDVPYCQQWGRCSQICYMSNTSYSCGCSMGYKLAGDKFTCISKDPFATSLLVATETEILIIYSLENRKQESVFLSHSSVIKAIDYYHSPTSDLIFWADNELKTIFAGLLGGGSEVLQNVHPIVQGGLTVVTSLAVDWVAHNLYWTDTGYHHIEVSKFDGTMRTLLVADVTNPESIAIDSKHGLIFWTASGKDVSKIERSALNGEQRQVIVSMTQSHNEGLPTGITLEYAMMHLYWVDGKSGVLHIVNYNGENHRVIYKDRKYLPRDYHLSIFENYIYWASEYDVGRINRWQQDDSDILTVVHSYAHDVKVLHPLRQPSAKRNPCAYKNGHCAHLCLFNNNLQVSCACSYGWKLNEDRRTCSKYKEYFTYIMREENEILIFFSQRQNLNHFISIPIRITTDRYSDIIYDPKSEQAFWADRNIVRTIRHNGPNRTVLELDHLEIISLSADSSSDILYLLTSATSGEESYLSLCTKTGAYFTHIIKFHHEKPLHISVDPINRVLIWSQVMKWNDSRIYTLESSLLDGSGQKRILQLNINEGFNSHLRFTLQYATKKIYLWDEISGDLMWTTYSGSSLHSIPSIKPSAVAADDNSIIYLQNNIVYEMNGNSTSSVFGNITRKVIHIDIVNLQSAQDHHSNVHQNCGTILIQVSFNHTTCVPKIGSRPFLAFLHNGTLRSSSLLDDTNSSFPVKLFTTSSRDDFDIDLANSMIYWTDNEAKAIFSMKADGTRKRLLVHIDGHIGQIAFDWVDGYVYWISEKDSSVWVTDNNGKYKYVVVQDNLQNPSALTIDPVHGFLFWADSGAPAHIERSLLSGARRKILISLVSAHISYMTAEIKEMMIYWTDSFAGTVQRITFDGLSQETLISKGDGFIVHPVSLATNDEYLFLTDKRYKGGCVLQVKKNNLSDVTALGENYGRNLGRIKLFDIRLQEGTNVCTRQRQHSCEHFCFFEGSKKYSCACAYSLLGEDKKHCVEYKQFMLMAAGTKIISVSLTDPTSLNAPFPPLVVGGNIQHIAALSYIRYQKKIIFSDSEQQPYLFSIKIDGTELTPLLKDGFVRQIESIAFDEAHGDIYWTDSARPSIFSLRIMQHGVTQHYPFEAEKILDLDAHDKPRGIVLHSCYLYMFWTNWRTDYPTIERAYFTGAQREVIISDNIVQPNGIVIDLVEETLIWADANIDDRYSIWSCNLDGSKRKKISHGIGHHPFDIVIHGSFLYWTDWETGSLLQTEKVTGKGPAIIRSNLGRPKALVVESAIPLTCPRIETKPPPLVNSSPSPGCYGYCYNEGVCILHEQSGKLICICAENFTGSRCDVEIYAENYRADDKRASSPAIIPITVLVVIIFICAVVGIVLCSRQHCMGNGNAFPLLKNPDACNYAENMTRESSFCNGSCEEDGILISPASEAVTFKKTHSCGKEPNMML